MEGWAERGRLERALAERGRDLDRKSEECAEQRGRLGERIWMLEKGRGSGRTGVEIGRGLRESIDNILTDRALN